MRSVRKSPASVLVLGSLSLVVPACTLLVSTDGLIGGESGDAALEGSARPEDAALPVDADGGDRESDAADTAPPRGCIGSTALACEDFDRLAPTGLVTNLATCARADSPTFSPPFSLAIEGLAPRGGCSKRWTTTTNPSGLRLSFRFLFTKLTKRVHLFRVGSASQVVFLNAYPDGFDVAESQLGAADGGGDLFAYHPRAVRPLALGVWHEAALELSALATAPRSTLKIDGTVYEEDVPLVKPITGTVETLYGALFSDAPFTLFLDDVVLTKL